MKNSKLLTLLLSSSFLVACGGGGGGGDSNSKTTAGGSNSTDKSRENQSPNIDVAGLNEADKTTEKASSSNFIPSTPSVPVAILSFDDFALTDKNLGGGGEELPF